jgi:surfeit locus 1 family protein
MESLGTRLLVHVYTNLTTYSILERLDELEYRRVQLHGHFDHSKELLMWPRSLNTESTGRGSEPGAHVVTPFYCEELGQLVLVNRGWVPRRKMDQDTRKRGQVVINSK